MKNVYQTAVTENAGAMGKISFRRKHYLETLKNLETTALQRYSGTFTV